MPKQYKVRTYQPQGKELAMAARKRKYGEFQRIDSVSFHVYQSLFIDLGNVCCLFWMELALSQRGIEIW